MPYLREKSRFGINFFAKRNTILLLYEQEQYFFTSYSYDKRMRALGATHEINPLYDVIHDQINDDMNEP